MKHREPLTEQDEFVALPSLAPLHELAFGAGMLVIPGLLIDIPSLASQGKPLDGYVASCIVLMAALAAFRLSEPLMLVLLATGVGIHLLKVDQPTFTLAIMPWLAYITSSWGLPSARVGVLVLDAFTSCIGGWLWAPWVAHAYGTSVVTGGVVAGALSFSITVFAFIIGLHVVSNSKTNAKFFWELWDVQRTFESQLREERQLVSMATRLEIARELHDILGHSLAVIVRQADGGALAGKKNPDVAIEALQVIATVSREGLQELRGVVGGLRTPSDTEDPEMTPQPGIVQIQRLVERAGEHVELRTTGEPSRVPPMVGIAAYRIVQESLTNFFKHAGAEEFAVVELTYTRGFIEIEVRNTGAVGDATERGPGSGIRGMKERVSALHGELTCGPQAAGGYAVHAKLPVWLPV
ncbi:MAG: histidine kinase [Propionibacteriaceae bacterium]|jgi:signal transduction histidine kinase|nr:histidine kinase [Propionibacteriaceae bacterium]